MATTFIRIPQSGGAPEDYLVSGAASIDLLSAAATWDGSGAGADFQPAVQILDESNQVVATALGSTVVAGDSASVTFAPFLETQGSACGGRIDSTATAGNTCGVHSQGAALNEVLTADGAGGSDWAPGGGYTPPTAFERIAAANVTTITAGNQASLDWSGGSQTGSSLLDLTAPTLPKVITAGIYSFTVWVGTQASNVQAGKEVISSMSLAIAGIDLQAAVPYVGATGGSAARMTLNGTCYFAANETVSVQVSNADTISHDFRIVVATVQRIT